MGEARVLGGTISTVMFTHPCIRPAPTSKEGRRRLGTSKCVEFNGAGLYTTYRRQGTSCSRRMPRTCRQSSSFVASRFRKCHQKVLEHLETSLARHLGGLVAIPTRRADCLFQGLYHSLIPRRLESDFGEIKRAASHITSLAILQTWMRGLGMITGLWTLR